ncbi:MAG: hypothetical protein R2864_03955 [Syntrophotaleaceae bacterium]
MMVRLRAIETALQYGEREYFRVNAEFSVKYRRLTDDAEVRPPSVPAAR